MPNKKRNQEPIEIKPDMKALLEVEQYGGIDGITQSIGFSLACEWWACKHDCFIRPFAGTQKNFLIESRIFRNNSF